MAYEMVMPYHLHMPSYFLETFTEYPFLQLFARQTIPQHYAERKNTSADTEKTKCFIYIPDKTIFLFPSRVLLNII